MNYRAIAIISCILATGCSLKDASECIKDQQMCTHDMLQIGLYQICTDNGNWSTPVSCENACDGDHCLSLQDIPACDKEKISCIENDVTSIALHCHKHQLFPQVCANSCTEPKGCDDGSGSSCKSSCLQIEAFNAAIETLCQNGTQVAHFCPTGIGCDGDHCAVPSPDDCEGNETKCIDEDNIGKIYTCHEGHWQTESCQANSCHDKSCGECKNGDNKCVNEADIGKTYTCENGQWNLKTDCQTTSCHDKSCGECKDGDNKCENDANVGKISTCENGHWNQTKDCKTSSCLPDNTCGECKSGDTYCYNREGVGQIMRCNDQGKWDTASDCGNISCEAEGLNKSCIQLPNYDCLSGNGSFTQVPENFDLSSGTQKQAYCIKDEADFRRFRDAINEGKRYPDNHTTGYYVLTKDLVLTDDPWTPIGNKDYPFKGYFYGNGHKISLKNPLIRNCVASTDDVPDITVVTWNSTGVFGQVEDSILSHLSVEVSTLSPTSPPLCEHGASSLAGEANNTTINYVDAVYSLKANEAYGSELPSSNYGCYGGIVGFGENVTFNHCKANVDIDMYGANVGGIIGSADQNLIINDCHTKGKIVSQGSIGGLVGYANSKTTPNEIRVIDSSSSINIYDICDSQFQSNSDCFAACDGGLIGQVDGVSMNNSHSTSHIESGKGRYLGGLIGCTLDNHSSVTNSYYIGSIIGKQIIGGIWGHIYCLSGTSPDLITATMTNSFSLSTLTTQKPETTGGWIGSTRLSNSIDIQNSYALSHLLTAEIGGLIGTKGSETITIKNSYYPEGTSVVAVGDVDTEPLKTASFAETASNTYTAQTGNKPLSEALGEGWKNFSCELDLGNGKKNYIIPFSTEDVPSFCKESPL